MLSHKSSSQGTPVANGSTGHVWKESCLDTYFDADTLLVVDGLSGDGILRAKSVVLASGDVDSGEAVVRLHYHLRTSAHTSTASSAATAPAGPTAAPTASTAPTSTVTTTAATTASTTPASTVAKSSTAAAASSSHFETHVC